MLLEVLSKSVSYMFPCFFGATSSDLGTFNDLKMLFVLYLELNVQ